jgi:hypothetical protein
MENPYRNLEVTNEYIIREFSENIDPIELLWHRDNETRTIEPTSHNNWKIQLDNQLPIFIDKSISIKKHEWHRLIKGSTLLTLKIYLHKDN